MPTPLSLTEPRLTVRPREMQADALVRALGVVVSLLRVVDQVDYDLQHLTPVEPERRERLELAQHLDALAAQRVAAHAHALLHQLRELDLLGPAQRSWRTSAAWERKRHKR